MTSLQRLLSIPAVELPHVLLRAVGSARHGITIADANEPDLPLVYLNQSFTAMTGYSADEVLGRNCRFLQGPDTDPAALHTIRTAIQEGRDCRTVLLNHRKDGTPFYNQLTISIVRDRTGQITHLIGVQIDVTDQIEHQQQLTRRATTDPLTGLGNRRRIIDTLQSWRPEAAGGNATAGTDGVAVVYLNIDNFHQVNDRHDYDIGNLVLIHLGRRLTALARSQDVVARLEGDTFALARRVPQSNIASVAADLARQVTAAVSQPVQIPAGQIPITVTCGAATWPGQGHSPESVLHAARENLHTVRAAARPRMT